MKFEFEDIRAGFAYYIESPEQLLKLCNGLTPWLASPTRTVVFRGQPNAQYWTRSRYARDFVEKYPDPLENNRLASEADINALAAATSQLPTDYLQMRDQVTANFLSANPDLKDANHNYATLNALAQHYGYYTDFLDFTFDWRIALYFAFDFQEPPDSGFVSISITTPWALGGALIHLATQNNFIQPDDLRPHVITEGKSSSITFPHPERIGRAINSRLNAQRACVICYPGLLPYEVLMYRQYWSFNFRENRLILLPAKLKDCVQELLYGSGINTQSLLLSNDQAEYL